MGTIVISSTLAVGPIAEALSAKGRPLGEAGRLLHRAFHRFAAKMQQVPKAPPY